MHRVLLRSIEVDVDIEKQVYMYIYVLIIYSYQLQGSQNSQDEYIIKVAKFQVVN